MPRYVPDDEWDRWMSNPAIRANPSLRDGPWGEQSAESRNRGKAAEMGGRVTAIRKGTEHPEEAFYFLEYLSSPDFNNLLTKDADAFGSRKMFSVAYFSRPAPDFPRLPPAAPGCPRLPAAASGTTPPPTGSEAGYTRRSSG